MILTPKQISEKKDLQFPCYAFYLGEWVKVTAFHVADGDMFIFYRSVNSENSEDSKYDSFDTINVDDTTYICISPEINSEEEEKCKKMNLELVEDIKNKLNEINKLILGLTTADLHAVKRYFVQTGLADLITDSMSEPYIKYRATKETVECLTHGYITVKTSSKEAIRVNLNNITKISYGKELSLILTLANNEEIIVQNSPANLTVIDILNCMFVR